MKLPSLVMLAITLGFYSVSYADEHSTTTNNSSQLLSNTSDILPSELVEIELLFATASTTLSKAAIAAIEPLIRRVRYSPTVALTLTGYSDARGSKNRNLVLSIERAKAVRDFLIDRGVRPNKIRMVAHGESRAAVNIQQLDKLVEDRRVVVTSSMLNGAVAGSLKANTHVYAFEDHLR